MIIYLDLICIIFVLSKSYIYEESLGHTSISIPFNQWINLKINWNQIDNSTLTFQSTMFSTEANRYIVLFRSYNSNSSAENGIYAYLDSFACYLT